MHNLNLDYCAMLKGEYVAAIKNDDNKKLEMLFNACEEKNLFSYIQSDADSRDIIIAAVRFNPGIIPRLLERGLPISQLAHTPNSDNNVKLLYLLTEGTKQEFLDFCNAVDKYNAREDYSGFYDAVSDYKTYLLSCSLLINWSASSSNKSKLIAGIRKFNTRNIKHPALSFLCDYFHNLKFSEHIPNEEKLTYILALDMFNKHKHHNPKSLEETCKEIINRKVEPRENKLLNMPMAGLEWVGKVGYKYLEAPARAIKPVFDRASQYLSR